MAIESNSYPARLDIEYPARLERLTTFFRIFWAIPILIILGLLTSPIIGGESTINDTGRVVMESAGTITGGLFAATALMILFRQRYPRWWFDFNLELNRFSTRVNAYLLLLTDRYPSTVDKQSVNLELDYPDVEQDLSRWLPLIKWLLAIPHYLVLIVLSVGAILATIVAWFTILFTGSYPKGLFNFVVGVERWGMRVNAYAFLLLTDKYPPFSLK